MTLVDLVIIGIAGFSYFLLVRYWKRLREIGLLGWSLVVIVGLTAVGGLYGTELIARLFLQAVTGETGANLAVENLQIKYGRIAVLVASLCIFSGFVANHRRLFRMVDQLNSSKRQLEESEQTARALLDASEDPIFLISTDGTILLANRALAHGLDQEPESIMGKCIYDLLPEDVAMRRRSHVEATIRSGEAAQFEDKRDDRIFDNRIYPVRCRKGQVTRIAVHTRDITALRKVEESLRLSEARLTEAQQIAHLGNWDLNVVTHEVWWSDEIYRIFGLEPQQFGATYEAFLEMVHPEDRDRVEKKVERALKQDERYDIDHRIVLPDNTVRTVHEQAVVIRDDDGRAVRMAGTVQDITERRQNEQALRESEEKFKAHFQHLPVPAYMWQRLEPEDDYVLVAHNRAALDITEGKAAVLPGSRFGDLYAEEPVLVADMNRCYSEQTGVSREMTYRYRSTGHVRELDVTYTYVPPDIVVIHTADITERRQSEQEVRLAKEQLDRLVSASPAIIYTCRPDGSAIYLTPNVRERLGYDAEEFSENPTFWRDHIHPEDRDAFLSNLPMTDEGREIICEYRFLNSAGEYRWMMDHFRLITDRPSETPLVVGYWLDITDRKEAELRLRESLWEKEVLLKEIHHRVKNNLQLISSLLNLESRQAMNPQMQDLCAGLQERIRSITLIHEQLYESGDMARVNFESYLHMLVGYLRTTAADVGSTPHVKVRVDHGELPVSTAIPCAMIVNELATNAFKHAFGDQSGGEVEIRFQVSEGKRTVVVSDNGVGMQPLPGGAVPKAGGLKLVEMLALRLGGTVVVESKDGTRVTVEFPAGERG